MTEEAFIMPLSDALLALLKFRRLGLAAEEQEIVGAIHQRALETDAETGRFLEHLPRTPVPFKAEKIVIDLIRILAEDCWGTKFEFFVKDRKLPVYSGLFVKGGRVFFDYFGRARSRGLTVFGTRLKDWVAGSADDQREFQKGPDRAEMRIGEDAVRLRISCPENEFGFVSYDDTVPLRLYFRTDSGVGFRSLGERDCKFNDGAYEIELSAEDLMEFMAAGCGQSVIAAGCIFMRFPDPMDEITPTRGKIFTNGVHRELGLDVSEPGEAGCYAQNPLMPIPADLCPILLKLFSNFRFSDDEMLARLLLSFSG